MREHKQLNKINQKSNKFHYPLKYCSIPWAIILRTISIRKRQEIILSKTITQGSVEKRQTKPKIAPKSAMIANEIPK